MMKRLFVILSFIFIAVCSSGAATIELPAIQDTYINLSAPDTTYDSEINFVVSRASDATANRQAFLQFDISRIYGIDKDRIISAKLKLNKATGDSFTGQVGRVDEPWHATELTWNNAPAITDISGVSWTINDDAGYTESADMTDFVKNWVSGQWPNYGIRLRTYGGGGYAATWIDSSEETEVRNLTPILEVEIEGSLDGKRIVPLNVIKDSYTDPGSPTQNFGNDYQLRVARNDAPNREIYLEFETTNLIGTDPNQIETAFIDMHRALLSGSDPNGPVGRVTEPWVEDTITYNNAPAVDESTGLVWEAGSGEGYNTFFDVNDLVKGWVAGDYPNYGIKMRQYSGGYSLMIFDSKEETTRNLPPRMEVTLKTFGSYDVPWWVGSVETETEAIYTDNNGNVWKYCESVGRVDEYLNWEAYKPMIAQLDGSTRYWQGEFAQARANEEGRLGRISGFWDNAPWGKYPIRYNGAIVLEPSIPGIYSWYGQVYCRVWAGDGPLKVDFVKFSDKNFPTLLHTEILEEGTIWGAPTVDLTQIPELQNISLKAGEKLAMVARATNIYTHVVAEFETPIGITIEEGSCIELGGITGDLNGDCQIGYEDLNMLAEQWLNCSNGTDVNCF